MLSVLGMPITRSSDYTRRRFGGRQPLCGTGVTSRIAVTSRPVAWRARIAASRPAPGPLTLTSTVRIPLSIATFAAVSAANCAANGVDLRDPLNPRLPEVAHEIALPCVSVIVMIVLLNVERMCTTPTSTCFLTLRLERTFCLRFAIVQFPPLLLLVRYCTAWAFTSTRVVLRVLTANRETTTVTNTAICADFDQTLNVE